MENFDFSKNSVARKLFGPSYFMAALELQWVATNSSSIQNKNSNSKRQCKKEN